MRCGSFIGLANQVCKNYVSAVSLGKRRNYRIDAEHFEGRAWLGNRWQIPQSSFSPQRNMRELCLVMEPMHENHSLSSPGMASPISASRTIGILLVVPQKYSVSLPRKLTARQTRILSSPAAVVRPKIIAAP